MPRCVRVSIPVLVAILNARARDQNDRRRPTGPRRRARDRGGQVEARERDVRVRVARVAHRLFTRHHGRKVVANSMLEIEDGRIVRERDVQVGDPKR